MKETQASLNFLVRGDEVLLAVKQQKIGAGRLNGVGGKQESGEVIEQTMIRESEEEIGVTPKIYKKLAEILFHNPSDDETLKHMRVHIYVTTEWTGEIAESDEMKTPTWFKKSQINYDEMMRGDDRFLPDYVFQDQPCMGVIFFHDDWQVDEKRSIIYTVPDFK
ncbi:MAG: NUDIX domain-containing protein [Candidatus Nomurabacteria bacterium]|nr:NUDIX domain-containing protein [Candidatus Nomurabacteria bacterium]